MRRTYARWLVASATRVFCSTTRIVTPLFAIAEMAAKVFPGCEIEFGDNGGDNRSYRVSFDKIAQHLPGFKCNWSAERGFRQLRTIFERTKMTDAVFKAPPYTRLRTLKNLMETSQVNPKLEWQAYDFQ